MRKTPACIWLSPADRATLEGWVGERNTPQKLVWRARIVLLSADRVGVMRIARAIGKSKVTGGRWQERYLARGVAGLRRDATRPGRKNPAVGRGHRTGGTEDLAGEAAGGNPLEYPQDVGCGRHQLHQRATDLEGTRPEAAPGQELQTLERQALRREGAGRGRALRRSAGEGGSVRG